MAAAAALRGKLTDIRQFNHKATQSTVDLNLDNKSLPPVVEDTLFPPPAPQVALNKAAPKTTTSSGASDKVFRTLKGIAAPMYMENVDTDMIIPKQFLKTLTRTGLAKGLFYNLRVDANTKAALDFVLDRPPFNDAKILISTGKNFGCGSSREHAAWSLNDFGIRCVIAPSFGEIFRNNLLQNCMLPIELSVEECRMLATDAEAGKNITVDLESEQITRDGCSPIPFNVDAFRRNCLLKGFDDIATTLHNVSLISAFEQSRSDVWPWLDGIGSAERKIKANASARSTDSMDW